jgi:hypothetical protein
VEKKNGTSLGKVISYLNVIFRFRGSVVSSTIRQTSFLRNSNSLYISWNNNEATQLTVSRLQTNILPCFLNILAEDKQNYNLPTKAAHAVTFLTCIWEVAGSNLGHVAGCPEAFRGFCQSLQAFANILPCVTTWPLPATRFPFYSLIIPPVDTIQSEILTVIK